MRDFNLKESNKNKYIDLGERGKLNLNNKLNDLTGKEWIKFSKSWFVHRPPRRKENEILHPAKFPESLVEEFIGFFSKKNDWILDPFLGTASTLIAAGKLNRNAAGIEINKKYYQISLERIKNGNYENKIIPVCGSSLDMLKLLRKEKLLEDIQFDYTITSPPYWNQLERNSIRQKDRKQKGLDTKYSKSKDDIGNLDSYEEFIEIQAKIFDQVFQLTKPNGYLTIITNNIYWQSKLYPLAFDTAVSLTKRGEFSWTLKDEKIWLQDDKPLIALGVNNAWVGNRHHQYCLIFRKEV
ncbi:MAG: site-specific DNA-methyltransferase [Melioribacteraceae bacterium]|nr:site-specific DNA-methyltransferase [Melioribacteraceae bacterium]MCF8353102.1 site-specific DNA-methyltransferase [Melioribacteraceae bacterium]MCF8392752.1 site-specific DNA-methyltransferase [Melioribacteraceae bacterium]MCF8418283.1 site-specific DNA-methyltransferase [Melioribacteraceae bacterium]